MQLSQDPETFTFPFANPVLTKKTSLTKEANAICIFRMVTGSPFQYLAHKRRDAFYIRTDSPVFRDFDITVIPGHHSDTNSIWLFDAGGFNINIELFKKVPVLARWYHHWMKRIAGEAKNIGADQCAVPYHQHNIFFHALREADCPSYDKFKCLESEFVDRMRYKNDLEDDEMESEWARFAFVEIQSSLEGSIDVWVPAVITEYVKHVKKRKAVDEEKVEKKMPPKKKKKSNPPANGDIVIDLTDD